MRGSKPDYFSSTVLGWAAILHRTYQSGHYRGDTHIGHITINPSRGRNHRKPSQPHPSRWPYTRREFNPPPQSGFSLDIAQKAQSALTMPPRCDPSPFANNCTKDGIGRATLAWWLGRETSFKQKSLLYHWLRTNEQEALWGHFFEQLDESYSEVLPLKADSFPNMNASTPLR